MIRTVPNLVAVATTQLVQLVYGFYVFLNVFCLVFCCLFSVRWAKVGLCIGCMQKKILFHFLE